MTPFHRLHRHPSPAATGVPAWAWLVLVAVLALAPWLGAVHGTLHAKGVTGGSAVSMPATMPAAAAHPAGGLQRLFGDHVHSGDCRIYDQLSHADGLHLQALLPPVVLPPVAVLAWHAGECLRRWATLFDARGPPSCS